MSILKNDNNFLKAKPRSYLNWHKDMLKLKTIDQNHTLFTLKDIYKL
jgi:hypothetical protein